MLLILSEKIFSSTSVFQRPFDSILVLFRLLKKIYSFIHARNRKIETRTRRFVCKIDPRYKSVKSKMADILMPCTIRDVVLYGHGLIKLGRNVTLSKAALILGTPLPLGLGSWLQ